MDAGKSKTSRRAFFLKGGAVVGASVAGTSSTAFAATGKAAPAPAHEAIRMLHVNFTGRMESQAYEAAAELFAEAAHLELSGVTAEGRAAILELFAQGYRHQHAAVLHTAYRPNGRQQEDSLQVSEDGERASGVWHVDVRIATPLLEDCTAAHMARLQGQMAEVRWETGLLEATYVKSAGQWRMASLDYRTA